MPIEPRHGQRIPSPRRLAKLVARVLRAMRLHAQRQVRAGKPVDLRAYEQVLANAVKPLVGHEWAMGAETGRRRLARRGRHRVRVKSALSAPLPAEAVAVAFDLFRPEAAAAASRLSLELAGTVLQTTLDRVRQAVREGVESGRTNDAIADTLGEYFSPERAYTIAATESSRAMHAGQFDAARAAGVWGMQWLASADACPECESLNGKKVKLGEPFYVDPRGGPYAVVLYPPRHPHCRCAVLDVFDEPATRVVSKPSRTTAVQETVRRPPLPANIDPSRPPASLPRIGKLEVLDRDLGPATPDAVKLIDEIMGNRDPDQIAAMANATDGATVTVLPEREAGKNSVRVITSGNGVKSTRKFSRNKRGELIIENTNLGIDDYSPYKGKGYELFAKQVQSLRDAGAKKIVTFAAGDKNYSVYNGYYTWMTFGYDGRIKKTTLAKLQETAPEIAKQLGDSKSIADLAAIPGGPEWWKENGHAFAGTFDLRDGSKSMKRLAQYLAERLAKSVKSAPSKAAKRRKPTAADRAAQDEFSRRLLALAADSDPDPRSVAALARMAEEHGFVDEIGEV